jgi:hemoglobin-like flavoprotein
MSWDQLKQALPGSEIGSAVYEMLLEMAPNLKHVLKKPRESMSIVIMDMMHKIVAFSEDRGLMDEELAGIACRHIRYGMKAHMCPIMGNVISRLFREALGEDWTEVCRTRTHSPQPSTLKHQSSNSTFKTLKP